MNDFAPIKVGLVEYCPNLPPLVSSCSPKTLVLISDNRLSVADSKVSAIRLSKLAIKRFNLSACCCGVNS